MIAALFVETNGCYFGLPDVDPWDVTRDARLYAGPHPVVAHPPCAQWCRLAGLVEHNGGRRRGDDDGCFASALESVRRWGGVLEHPAWTAAFAAHGLPIPDARGWQRTLDGNYVALVDQGAYGHLAAKATWLYGVDIEPIQLRSNRIDSPFVVSKTRRTMGTPKREMPKRLRHVTPIAFRDALLDMARSVQRRAA